MAEDRKLFLALTLVVIFVVLLLLCSDHMGSVLIIEFLQLALGVYIAYTVTRKKREPAPQEHYVSPPAPPSPDPITPVAPFAKPMDDTKHYPGSIDVDEYDTKHYPGSIDVDEYDTEAAYGHRDRAEEDNDSAPEGNAYELSRISSPIAAGACADDEANDAEIDGDEQNVYQVRSRNDATRVTAGTMNRRRDLDQYLREEVAEAEDRMWWGRHEY